MIRFDFSETRRQLIFITSALLRGRPSEEQKKAAQVAESLVTNLDTRQMIMWIIFAVTSVSATIMLLWFIDSFNSEQEKYQTVLTSIGRSRAEYKDLNGETGTNTKRQSVLLPENYSDLKNSP